MWWETINTIFVLTFFFGQNQNTKTQKPKKKCCNFVCLLGLFDFAKKKKKSQIKFGCVAIEPRWPKIKIKMMDSLIHS